MKKTLASLLLCFFTMRLAVIAGAEDSIRRISCEGITDSSTLSQTFVSKEDYLREIEIHCASRYTYCELYNAIMEAKYLDD